MYTNKEAKILEYVNKELKILYQAYEDHTANNAAQAQSIVKSKIKYLEDIREIIEE